MHTTMTVNNNQQCVIKHSVDFHYDFRGSVHPMLFLCFPGNDLI